MQASIFRIPPIILGVSIGALLSIKIKKKIKHQIKEEYTYSLVMKGCIIISIALLVGLTGLMLNKIAVKENGNIMPTPKDIIVENIEDQEMVLKYFAEDERYMDREDMKLYYLCDILFFKGTLIFKRVSYSVGDILISIAFLMISNILSLVIFLRNYILEELGKYKTLFIFVVIGVLFALLVFSLILEYSDYY